MAQNRALKTILVGASLCGLVACGGGGGGSDAPPAPDPDLPPFGGDVTPLVDVVYNDQAPSRDYIGKTFPVMFIARDTETGRANRVAGTIEYVDADTMRVTYDDVTSTYTGNNLTLSESTDPDAPITRLEMQDTQFWNSNAGLNSTGEVVVAFPYSSSEDDLAVGVFGFVTPEARLSGSVTYTSDRGTTVMFSGPSFIDEDGTDANHVERMETVESTFGCDCMRLTASFDDNTISGTLFEGTYSVTDNRGITSTNTHDVKIDLVDGVIDGSEFTGDLALSVTPSSNPSDGVGAGAVRDPAIIEINSQAMDGFFLGADGKGIMGSFEMDYDQTYERPKGFDEPSDVDLTVTENRTLVGTFIGSEE